MKSLLILKVGVAMESISVDAEVAKTTTITMKKRKDTIVSSAPLIIVRIAISSMVPLTNMSCNTSLTKKLWNSIQVLTSPGVVMAERTKALAHKESHTMILKLFGMILRTISTFAKYVPENTRSE